MLLKWFKWHRWPWLLLTPWLVGALLVLLAGGDDWIVAGLVLIPILISVFISVQDLRTDLDLLLGESDLAEEEIDRMYSESITVGSVAPPGTAEARAEGCACLQLWGKQGRRYRVSPACPIHMQAPWQA